MDKEVKQVGIANMPISQWAALTSKAKAEGLTVPQFLKKLLENYKRSK